MGNIRQWLIVVHRLFFWRIISLTSQLLADCDSTIYADDIFALNVTNETQHHGKIVAWTYSGDIFFLDKNLYLIREIKILQVSINDISAINSLLAWSDPKSNYKTTRAMWRFTMA